MALLAILITTILQYFTERGEFLVVPDQWIALYWDLMSKRLINLDWRIGLLLLLLPLWLSLALLQLGAAHLLQGFCKFAVVLTVLLATVRLFNCQRLLEEYHHLQAKGDEHDRQNFVAQLSHKWLLAHERENYTQVEQCNSCASSTATDNKLAYFIIISLFKNWLVGIFWFILAGIYGVVSYWLWRELAKLIQNRIQSQNSSATDNDTPGDDNTPGASDLERDISVTADDCANADNDADDNPELEKDLSYSQQFQQQYLAGLTYLLYWAEFIPARLWALGYALVGEFVAVFDWLMTHLWQQLPNEQLVYGCSRLALGTHSAHSNDNNNTVDAADDATDTTAIETQSLLQTVRLQNRLLIFAGLLAIFMLI